MSFLIRLFVNAAALWVATRIVPGVTYSGDLLPFLGVVLVFGIVNAFIGPVAKLLAHHSHAWPVRAGRERTVALAEKRDVGDGSRKAARSARAVHWTEMLPHDVREPM